jgi:hypothetical protein
MSYDTTRGIITKYVQDNFSGWTIVPENRPFEPSSGQVWVSYGIRPNDESAMEVGGTWERVIGFIWFSIFLPENSGSAEAHKVGDKIKQMFFQKHITNDGKPTVITQSATLRYVGQETSGRQHWSVTVPYRVDAVVA